MTSHNLSIGAAEELAEWFLARMGQDQRGRLMAERPQLYAEIFPDVSREIIVRHVSDAMTMRCTTCHRSAHTRTSTSYHGHAWTG